MKKKLLSLSLVVLMLFSMSSCYTLEHTVGNGAQGGNEVSQRQWYALWGLVPINEVDSKSMAAGKSNYVIKTQHSFIDLVISMFTGIVTIQAKTVTVKH